MTKKIMEKLILMYYNFFEIYYFPCYNKKKSGNLVTWIYRTMYTS